jgi:hypothetical protein
MVKRCALGRRVTSKASRLRGFLIFKPMMGGRDGADAKDNNAQYGHIEIRTPNGFASDYYRPKARTGPVSNGLSGSGRRLIGVYVNPQ